MRSLPLSPGAAARSAKSGNIVCGRSWKMVGERRASDAERFSAQGRASAAGNHSLDPPMGDARPWPEYPTQRHGPIAPQETTTDPRLPPMPLTHATSARARPPRVPATVRDTTLHLGALPWGEVGFR